MVSDQPADRLIEEFARSSAVANRSMRTGGRGLDVRNLTESQYLELNGTIVASVVRPMSRQFAGTHSNEGFDHGQRYWHH